MVSWVRTGRRRKRARGRDEERMEGGRRREGGGRTNLETYEAGGLVLGE